MSVTTVRECCCVACSKAIETRHQTMRDKTNAAIVIQYQCPCGHKGVVHVLKKRWRTQRGWDT